MAASRKFQSDEFSFFFDLQVARYFLLSFESIGLIVQEKKLKIDFQDGSHGRYRGFPIGTILAICDLQVASMLPTQKGKRKVQGVPQSQIPSFESIGLSVQESRFLRLRPWGPPWISDRNNFSYFRSTSHPNTSYQVSSRLAQGCKRCILLKQIVDSRRRTTDTDRSQQLNLSTLCSDELSYLFTKYIL